jgi:hypothetical protein
LSSQHSIFAISTAHFSATSASVSVSIVLYLLLLPVLYLHYHNAFVYLTPFTHYPRSFSTCFMTLFLPSLLSLFSSRELGGHASGDRSAEPHGPEERGAAGRARETGRGATQRRGAEVQTRDTAQGDENYTQ